MSNIPSSSDEVRKPAPSVGQILKGAVIIWSVFLVFFFVSKFAPAAGFWKKKEAGTPSVAEAIPEPVQRRPRPMDNVEFIQLQPGVWSAWQSIGWNTDTNFDWNTPDRFLDVEFNDGSSFIHLKHGVQTNFGTRVGARSDGSALQIRFRSETGGHAWITKSWRGFFR